MNHKGTVMLETERLMLKRNTEETCKTVFKHLFHNKRAAIKGDWKYYSKYKDLINITQFDDNLTTYNWVIFLKDKEIPIGFIDAHTIDDDDLSCEIGYALSYKYWNNGYMTEALKKVITFLTLKVGFNKVFAKCSDKNIASIKVMEKVGMRYENFFSEFKFKIFKYVYSNVKKI